MKELSWLSSVAIQRRKLCGDFDEGKEEKGRQAGEEGEGEEAFEQAGRRGQLYRDAQLRPRHREVHRQEQRQGFQDGQGRREGAGRSGRKVVARGGARGESEGAALKYPPPYLRGRW